MTEQRIIHETHLPETDDARRLRRTGWACMRCCRFVAFDNPYRVTDSGVATCLPAKVELR